VGLRRGRRHGARRAGSLVSARDAVSEDLQEVPRTWKWVLWWPEGDWTNGAYVVTDLLVGEVHIAYGTPAARGPRRSRDEKLVLEGGEAVGVYATLDEAREEARRDWAIRVWGPKMNPRAPSFWVDDTLDMRFPLAEERVQLRFEGDWEQAYAHQWHNVYVVGPGIYARWMDDGNEGQGLYVFREGDWVLREAQYIDMRRPAWSRRLKALVRKMTKPARKNPGGKAPRNPRLTWRHVLWWPEEKGAWRGEPLMAKAYVITRTGAKGRLYISYGTPAADGSLDDGEEVGSYANSWDARVGAREDWAIRIFGSRTNPRRDKNRKSSKRRRSRRNPLVQIPPALIVQVSRAWAEASPYTQQRSLTLAIPATEFPYWSGDVGPRVRRRLREERLPRDPKILVKLVPLRQLRSDQTGGNYVFNESVGAREPGGIRGGTLMLPIGREEWELYTAVEHELIHMIQAVYSILLGLMEPKAMMKGNMPTRYFGGFHAPGQNWRAGLEERPGLGSLARVIVGVIALLEEAAASAGGRRMTQGEAEKFAGRVAQILGQRHPAARRLAMATGVMRAVARYLPRNEAILAQGFKDAAGRPPPPLRALIQGETERLSSLVYHFPDPDLSKQIPDPDPDLADPSGGPPAIEVDPDEKEPKRVAMKMRPLVEETYRMLVRPPRVRRTRRTKQNPRAPETEMTLGTIADARTRHAERVLGRKLSLTWDIGPYEHFDTARGFGVTFTHHNNPAWGVCHIRLSEKLRTAAQTRQDAIIRHELGHVIDLSIPPGELDLWAAERGVQLPPQANGEIRADAIALAVWGTPLCYDSATVQSTCCGVDDDSCGISPRPAHLGL
jgi:hypothetical protein